MLTEWAFNVPATTYIRKLTQEPSPTTALTTLLHEYSELQAPSIVMRVLDSTWTAELSDIIALALPTLPNLRTELSINKDMTDEQLGVMLRMGTHIRKLSMNDLDVYRDEHVATPWPWEELSLRELYANQLLRLPLPSTYTGANTPVLRCEEMVLYMITEVRKASQGIPHSLLMQGCTCLYVHLCVPVCAAPIVMSCLLYVFPFVTLLAGGRCAPGWVATTRAVGTAYRRLWGPSAG